MSVSLAFGGALGRMGRANLHIASTTPGVTIAGGWERDGHPDKGKDLGELAGLGRLNVLLQDKAAAALATADAAIDFSTPEATLAALEAAKARPIPFVIGTTGLSPEEKAKVAGYAKLAPVIHSSNFSIGVNVLWKIAAEAARATGQDYDIEIVDVHHHHKKDAPSGTAMTTAEVLAKARGSSLEELAVYGRGHTRDGSRLPGQIGIHALRAGDVVGDHTIFFAGPYERLELTHRAHARENFAIGAVKAGLWLLENKKGPGLYSMAQVLGLEP